MAVFFPGSLEHNNPSYPIVDSSDVKGGYTTVTSVTERNSIPQPKRSLGMMVTIDSGTSTTYRFDGTDTGDTEWNSSLNWTVVNTSSVTIPSNPNGVVYISGGDFANSSSFTYDSTNGQLGISDASGSSISLDFVSSVTSNPPTAVELESAAPYTGTAPNGTLYYLISGSKFYMCYKHFSGVWTYTELTAAL